MKIKLQGAWHDRQLRWRRDDSARGMARTGSDSVPFADDAQKQLARHDAQLRRSHLVLRRQARCTAVEEEIGAEMLKRQGMSELWCCGRCAAAAAPLASRA